MRVPQNQRIAYAAGLHGVDWANPLSRGLISAVALGRSANPRDALTQRLYAPSGSPLVLATGAGRGLRFPATNDIISAPLSERTIANAPLSAMVWCRVEDTTATNRKRALRLFDATNGTIFQIEFAPGATLNFISASIQYSAALFEETVGDADGPAYLANRDYILGASWEPNDNVRLFVDGVLADASPNTRATILAGGNLTLGGNTSGGGLQLRGTLYLAYVWKRKLQAREFNYLAGFPWALFAQPQHQLEPLWFPGAAAASLRRRLLPMLGVG